MAFLAPKKTGDTLPRAAEVRHGVPETRRFSLREPDAARGARAFARGCLRDWRLGDPEFTADVTLVVGELVTNALRHAEVPEELRLTRGPGSVTVEVDDTGPGRPTALSPRTLRGSGRGLAIVAALACRWTVRRRSGGDRKTVCAVLSHPAESAAVA